MNVLEFYNKVHAKTDGKFAETPGPGHAKGAPKATPKQAAALKKVLSKPKTKAGSVIVATKTAAKNSDTKAPASKSSALKKVAEKLKVEKATKATGKPVPVTKKAAPAPKAKSSTELNPEIAANYKNPLLHKSVEQLTAKDKDAMFDAIPYKSKGAGSQYEYHSPEEGEGGKHGYLIDGDTGKYIQLKAGMTIASAASLLIKKVGSAPKPEEHEDEYEAAPTGTKEEQRIAKLLQKIPSRIVEHNTVADLDEIGGGQAVGMNDLPPPSGIKASKLTDDHIVALAEYRGTGYKQINDTLRRYGAKATKGMKSVIDNLDAAFSTASVSTQEITVYRGIEGFKPGKGFTDMGYTSTSYDENSASSFGDHVIRIVIPRGTPLLKVSGDSSQGHYAGEAELLLPRGSTYIQQSDGSYRVDTQYAGQTEVDVL